MRSVYTFLIACCLIGVIPVYGQNVCDLVTPICSNESFGGDPPSGNPGGSIDGGCQTLEADDVTWYYIRIQSGTTFTFQIVPDNYGDDYDFAAWKNPNCNNLGEADRASYSIPYTGVTGLMLNETDVCEGAGGGGNVDEMVRHFDVVPGDEIYIAIDKFDDLGEGFVLEFGGNAELDCTIVGESYGICDTDTNGQEDFDLNLIRSELTIGEPSWTVDFYEVETDAQAGNANTESSPYTAYLANNPTELFARIESNGTFQRIIKLFLYVNELPQIITPVELSLCDIGGDGEETFDLTLAQDDLVTYPNIFTYKYYLLQSDAIAGTNNFINPANAYTSGAGTIYVRIESGALDGNEEGCFSIGQINLSFTEEIETVFTLSEEYCINSTPPLLPSVSENGITGTWNPATIDTSTIGTVTYTFTPNPNQCADEYQIEIEIVEGITPEFSLENTYCEGTTPPTLPTTSDDGVPGSWFPTVIDTSGTGTTTYTFTPDNPECTAEYEIEITIVNGVELDNTLSISICDDNFDGNYEFDLTSLDQELINPTTGLEFDYYASYADYNNDNPIPQSQLENYTFTLPASIWVTATNGEGCRSQAVEVQFVAGEEISIPDDTYEIAICDDESIDLTQHYLELTNETGVEFSYYLTLANAQNDTGEITSTNYTPAGAGTEIYVRIEKIDGSKCPVIVTIEFVAGQEVMHNSGPFGPVEYCADDTVNLTDFTSGIANESGVTITYYETNQDAQNGSNPITDTTDFPLTGNGTIYVKLEKNDRCSVILELPYEQLPSPELEEPIPAEFVLCEGQETIEIEVTSDDPGATFVWSWGSSQTQSGPSIIISETGNYVLTITGSNSCRTTEEFVVRPGGQPTIVSIESGDNYLIVFAEPGEGGTLEYSLNGVLWQSSPRFDNLIKGETYIVYVREDGCLVKTHTAVILDVPNFVSPNGDGYNDLWTIRGIEITPAATIKIFDRYGKIFVDTNFDGNYVWDGKYGGRPLPSGDYWYILEVPTDGVVLAQKFVGHITVKN